MGFQIIGENANRPCSCLELANCPGQVAAIALAAIERGFCDRKGRVGLLQSGIGGVRRCAQRPDELADAGGARVARDLLQIGE